MRGGDENKKMGCNSSCSLQLQKLCLVSDETVFDVGRRLVKKRGPLAYPGVAERFSESMRAAICRGMVMSCRCCQSIWIPEYQVVRVRQARHSCDGR